MIPQYQPVNQPPPIYTERSPLGNSNVRPRVIPPSARKHFKNEYDQRVPRVFKPTNIQVQKQPVIDYLTPEEGEKLLGVWRSNNFIEFNAWCQIANARLIYKITENIDEENRKLIKSYLCTLNLSFRERNNVQPINVLGFGKNKKSAKKDAIEKCIIELIQTAKIIFGLRNKKFLEKAQKLQIENKLEINKNEYIHNNNNNNVGKLSSKDKNNLQKLIHKLSKKMQNSLKNDKFSDACSTLSHILHKKKPDWNEIAFIWTYALLKHNIVMVYALLEIIFQGKSSAQALNPQQHMNFLPCSNDPVKRAYEEKIHKDLMGYYCTSRFKAQNPYDLIDICNHELNNLEIDFQARLGTDEDNQGRLLDDPYSNATNALVIIDNQSYMMGDNMNNKQELGLGRQNTQSISNSLLQMNLMQMGTQLSIGAENTNNTQQGVDIGGQGNNRISPDLLEEMYETLFYQGDLTFCLHVAEKIYEMARLDNEDFVSYQAGQYYSNRKSQIFVEQLEQVYQTFMKPINRDIDYYTSISGTFEKIGNKYTYDVLIFTPQEPESIVCQKILRWGTLDAPDPLHMIQQDDFVLITCTTTNTISNTINTNTNNNSSDCPLTLYLNQFIKNPMKIKDNQNFIQGIRDNSSIQSIIEYSMIGCVKEVEKDLKLKVYILPNKLQSDAIRDNNKIWRITRLVNKYNYDVYSDSLYKYTTKLCSSPMLMQIILAMPTHSNPYALTSLAESVIHTEKKDVPTNLNESQYKALKAASCQLLTLIHGPPGTGKTILSVEIILNWLRNNNSNNNNNQEQILICCPNNLQVDIIHQELCKANILAERVGPQYDEQIDAYNIQKLKNSKNPTFNIPNMKYIMARKLLSQAHVICSTCEGLGSPYLKNCKFNKVLVDGASYITEVAVLAAIIRDCQQLVLIGDHKQPGPKIKSIFAQSKGLRISLFERFVKLGLHTHLLDIQYRMHPTLSYYPIKNFYNGGVRDGVNPELRSLVPGFKWPNPHLRVAFINVRGPEQNYAASIQNLKETEVLVTSLMFVLRNQQLRTFNIGILTPYEAQKRRIKYEIFYQATKYSNLFGISLDEIQKMTKNTQIIDIETTDENYMLEKELVLVSTVRSNTKGLLGVLKDLRQINVILNKARRGDAETLRNDIIWKEWLDWIRANRAEINYNKN